MVYDKIHDPTHPRAERLDQIYKRVEKALDALTKFYEKQEFISVAEYFKMLIYDNLNDNYEDYLEVNHSKGSSTSSESSYFTASSDTTDNSE